MLDDKSAPANYYHPKNISIGKGRVLYAKAATDINGNAHPEGWVLPGGRRTQDPVAAHNAAMALNALAQEA